MRTTAAGLLVGVMLVGGALSACTESEGPPVSPGPLPSGTPVFASEEEALAAAEDLYAEFREIADEVGRDGWKDTKALESVLMGDALEAEEESASELARKGYRLIGDSTFDTLVIQQLKDGGPGQVKVSFYACDDLTGVDVVDKSGSSVVSPSRPDRQAIEVHANDREGALKIERREAWSGSDFC